MGTALICNGRSTFLFPGEPRTPAEVQGGFDVILSSIGAARRAMKPGVTGFKIDQFARELITTAGYAEFPHALGHQVGRFAHDGTALLGPAWEKYASKPFEKLEREMVFTIEPRLSVRGHGVVTIEEMVDVTADGAEYLCPPPGRAPPRATSLPPCRSPVWPGLPVELPRASNVTAG